MFAGEAARSGGVGTRILGGNGHRLPGEKGVVFGGQDCRFHKDNRIVVAGAIYHVGKGRGRVWKVHLSCHEGDITKTIQIQQRLTPLLLLFSNKTTGDLDV